MKNQNEELNNLKKQISDLEQEVKLTESDLSKKKGELKVLIDKKTKIEKGVNPEQVDAIVDGM